MNLRNLTLAWAAAALTASAGCEPEPLTEIMVLVDTDMAVPSELDGFLVKIYAQENPDSPIVERPFDLVTQTKLPADFGVLPRDGDASRQITVDVTANVVGHDDFTTRAITTFVEGRKVYLQMFLARRCIGVQCSEDETCRREGCVPVDVPPILPELASFEASSLGSPGNDAPHEVVGDASGVYVAGTYGAAMTHGGHALPAPAGTGALLAAFAPDGTHRFTRGLPSTGLSYANRIVLLEGGAIEATGYFGGTLTESSSGQSLTSGGSQVAYLARYSSQGALQALEIVGIGSTNVQNFAAAALPNGMRAIGGLYGETASFGVKNTRSLTTAGIDDAYVVLLDDDLSAVWALGMGGVNRERVTSLATSDGAIYAGGYFEIATSLGATALSGAGENGYVTRISHSGELEWARAFAGAADDVVRDVAALPDGGVVAVGSSASADLVAHTQPLPGNDADAIVVALSSAGDVAWAKRFTGAGSSEAWSVALGQYKGEPALIVGGTFSGELSTDTQTVASQGSDLFAAVLTLAGETRFVQVVGGAASEGRAEVAAHGARMWLAGEFRENVAVGSRAFTGSGSTSDILLLQIAP